MSVERCQQITDKLKTDRNIFKQNLVMQLFFATIFLIWVVGLFGNRTFKSPEFY